VSAVNSALNVITQYWNPDINPAIMISVGLVLLFIFNMWSVR
jgi:amino acid permease